MIRDKLSNVAILAGGEGTRLQGRTGNVPKPMVMINNKPVLQHQIELCRKFGFIKILLLVYHQYEIISNFFGDGSGFGVHINYKIEKTPRGTAGALRDSFNELNDQFILLYGDTYLDVDLRKIWEAHLDRGANATLFLHPNDHPYDSDIVVVGDQNQVLEILPYPHPLDKYYRNLVNAALCVLDKNGILDVTSDIGSSDIAKDMFPKMLKRGDKLLGYISSEYIKDMGTPDRLDKVEFDIKSGIPEKLSLRHPRRAVFLDRDGTLIKEVNHLSSPENLELLPEVANAIQRLNRDGTLAVVITNQPVVARGDITFEQLNQIHAKLDTDLGHKGAYLDGLYYCPHHPSKGYSGEVLSLKTICTCRKPEVGLFNKACQDLNIDKHSSWMIGDTTSDIEAARKFGVRSILLRTGYAGTDLKYAVRPDFTCSDLPDAIEWILNGHEGLTRRMVDIASEAKNKRLILIGGLARSGKSFAAQVLKELLQQIGRNSHIISLDGWLKPYDQRIEGVGVCERYDLSRVEQTILQCLNSKDHQIIQETLHNRVPTRVSRPLQIEHSVGPEDILIVEGVPALLIDKFISLAKIMKIYMDIDSVTRGQRLTKDYLWRGQPNKEYISKLASREFDETPVVMRSRSIADFVL